MKSFSKVLAKFSKVWMLALLCVLFLGVKAEAATGTVKGVKQTNHTYNAVLLEWKNATGDVNGYKVEWCKDTSFQGTTYGSSTEPITKVEYAIQGLAAGSDYYVRVSAIDSNGELGTPSAPLQVVTLFDQIYEIIFICFHNTVTSEQNFVSLLSARPRRLPVGKVSVF